MQVKKLSSDEMNVLENNVNVTKKIVRDNYLLHWHDFFEIEFISSGSGVQILNGQETRLEKGAVCLLTPNDFHEIRCNGEVELFNIQFAASMIDEETLRYISNPANRFECVLKNDNFSELVFLTEALRVGKTKELRFKKNILNSIITIIIDNSKNKTEKKISKFSNNAVDKAKLYMTIYFKNNPTLDEIAAYVGLNRSYFSRLFTKATKEPPMQYMTSLKLSYAKTMLISTSLSITEIAFICGFGSFANFSKSFKKYYNITPKQMREIHKNTEA